MRKFNWQIWLGFLLSVFALLSYKFIFINWPATRDFPWANIALFVIAGVLLFIGLSRALRSGRRLISKLLASVLALLSTFGIAIFIFAGLLAARWLPSFTNAL